MKNIVKIIIAACVAVALTSVIATTFPVNAQLLGGGTGTINTLGGNGKVKASSNDTTAGYLLDKLVAGTNITLTENNNGSNETVTISASGGGTPGGSDTQLQYNNAGAFGGISGATTNGTVVTLTSPVIATSQTNSYATASTVPYFDASKKLISSAVTPTELGYVSGVTSSIQTQLDGKASTTAYTLAAVSALSTDATKSRYTMTSTIPVEFRRSGGVNAFYIYETSGNVIFGDTTSTGTTTPLNVSFGGTYGTNTPGNQGNLKWTMWESGGTKYGIGMSSGKMEYQVPAGAAHHFFNNGVSSMILTSSAKMGVGTATTTPNDYLTVGSNEATTGIQIRSSITTPNGSNYSAGRIVGSINAASGYANTYLDLQYATGDNTFTTGLRLTGGNIGIGSTTPTLGHLQVTDTGTASTRGLGVTQHNNGVQGALINYYKSRGTEASPTTIVNGDYSGIFTYNNYDGTAYRTNANFGWRSTGTVGTNSLPGQLFFAVSSASDNDPYTTGDIAMVINHDNNIGIGTTTPQTLLHIQGTTPAFRIQDTSGGSASFYSHYGVSGNDIAQLSINRNPSTGVFVDTGKASGQLSLNSATAASGGSFFQFYTSDLNNVSPTERMRITGAGNIGIGTSSPSARTHIISTTEQLRVGYDTSNYFKATVSSANATTFTPGTNSTAAFNFTNAAGTSILNVDSTNQKVGIGTTTPTLALDVIRSTSGSGLVYLKNTSTSGYSAFDMYDSSGTYAGGFGYANASASVLAGKLFFSSNSKDIVFTTDLGTTQHMTLTSSGGLLARYLVEANTAGSGSPNILTATESRSVLTNEGSTARNYHTLPSAAAGYSFIFITQDSDLMRITAATGDTISINGVTSASGGYIESSAVGDTVTLISINATEWIAVSSTGTFTVN